MATGIYCISNMENGHCYIGSAAISIAKRWGEHKSALHKGTHHSYRLQSDWPLYGESSFRFSVLWECPPEVCLGMEQLYIDRLHPYYNICRVAGSCLGRVLSPESRAKISASNRNPSPATRARMRAAKQNISPETRAKMSAAAMGNKKGLGHHFTPEQRAKIGATQKGKVMSPESRAKMSAAQIGHIGHRHTPESKAKMSIAAMGNKRWLGRHHTQETKAKLRAAMTHHKT